MFNNALITVEFAGDNGNVTGSLGFFTNTAGLFTVSVSGIGAAIFTGSMQVFDNQTSTPAAAQVRGSVSLLRRIGVGTFSTVFASYNLTTRLSFAPTSPSTRRLGA